MSDVIKDYRHIKIMLLGPGEYIGFRREVKSELSKLGYPLENIIIMEDIEDISTDMSLDDKFRRITDDIEPDLFIAFFHNNSRTDSVAFEIGWLCCKFKIKNVGKRLRFLHEPMYNWVTNSAYIRSLFITVTQTTFEVNPTVDYLSAPLLIHHIASINSEDKL